MPHLMIQVGVGIVAIVAVATALFTLCVVIDTRGDTPPHRPEPDYPAIGRAYLADEAARAAGTWCPYCRCQDWEHTGRSGWLLSGEPRLCQQHNDRLAAWVLKSEEDGGGPKASGRAVVGMVEYAERVTGQAL